MPERIDKIIASSGVASRSEVKNLIRKGAVSVNGETVKSPQDKIDPVDSVIMVNGERIHYSLSHCYVMNKPAGYVTSTEDPRDKTVMDLVPDRLKKLGVFPAGRLDKDSEGLLIFTDDGALAHNLISPGKNVKKVYYIETEGGLSADDEGIFAAGVKLKDGYICLPANLEIVKSGEKSTAFVTVNEGKYHQVKRMVAACGKRVTYLKRVRIGNFTLPEDLALGEIRELKDEEIDLLFER